MKQNEISKSEISKSIALYKLENPESSISDIAKKFKVKDHVARYAIDKYAEDTQFLKLNKKSKIRASRIIADISSDTELLRKQLSFVIAQLETNDSMPLTARVEFLTRIIRIKVQLSNIELQNHLKKADATIIAAIIKRFLPDATNEDIIKIYNEELIKSKNED
jgi:hypothetical protein